MSLDFVSGPAYAFSGNLVERLYHCATRDAQDYPLEDVFLSGNCATLQLGLNLTSEPRMRWRKPMLIQ